MEAIQSEQAERAAVGAVLVKPLALTVLRAELSPDDFQTPPARAAYEAMVALDFRRVAIDPLTVADELRARGQLGMFEGGIGGITALANETPTGENVGHYVALVRQKSMLRRLRAECMETSAQAGGDVGDVDQWAAERVAAISAAAGRGRRSKFNLSETAQEVIADLEKAERGEDTPRIATGMARLDAKLRGGMENGFLVVPAALTSIGKTSWAIQVAFRGAAERGVPFFFASTEMSRKALLIKGAASIERVDTSAFKYGGEPVDWRTVNRALGKVVELGDLVTISESRSLGHIVMEMSAWAQRHPGKKLGVVDYIQRVKGFRGRGMSREEEIAGIAQALKSLAVDLDLPIVAPSQLDNDAAKQKRAPQIGDLRESKAIEMEADLIIGLHRDRLAARSVMEQIVLKNRTGAVGKIRNNWEGGWQGFEELETEDSGDED